MEGPKRRCARLIFELLSCHDCSPCVLVVCHSETTKSVNYYASLLWQKLPRSYFRWSKNNAPSRHRHVFYWDQKFKDKKCTPPNPGFEAIVGYVRALVYICILLCFYFLSFFLYVFFFSFVTCALFLYAGHLLTRWQSESGWCIGETAPKANTH